MAPPRRPAKALPPPGWRPRVVVTDVDGTLTHKNRRIDPVAIEALRACEAAGVPVVLATGNVLPIAYALAYLVGTSGPVVAENGGLVYHEGKVEQLARTEAVDEVAAEVEGSLGLKRLFTDRWRVTEVAFPEGPSTFEDVTRAVRAHPLGSEVAVERTGFAVHLMNPHLAKFEGVVRALEIMGLTAADAIAIGDSDNDIGMLRGCRVGVALGDGSPRLKAAADLVVSRPVGEGILEALRRFGVVGATTAAAGARGAPRRGRRSRRPSAPRARGQGPARARSAMHRAAKPAGRQRTRS